MLGVGTDGPPTNDHKTWQWYHCSTNTWCNNCTSWHTERSLLSLNLFHLPQWRQFIKMECINNFLSFSPPLYLRKFKVEVFMHSFYFVHSWKSNACHGGEECPAHAYGHFVWKGGSNYLLKNHRYMVYIKCISTHLHRHKVQVYCHLTHSCWPEKSPPSKMRNPSLREVWSWTPCPWLFAPILD
jgi:hypothetical protein